MQSALEEFLSRRRTVIITDSTMEKLGHVQSVLNVLDGMGVQFRIFAEVLPDPDLSTARRALEMVSPWPRAGPAGGGVGSSSGAGSS